MKTRVIGTVVLVIVFLVFTLYIFGFLHIPVFSTSYKIGEEIKGFPVDELSITFGNYTTAKSVNIPNMPQEREDYKYIIFPVTVKNLASQTLYFDRQDDFTDRLNEAKAKLFVLTYGEKNYEASTQSGYYMESVPSNTIYGGSELKYRSLDWGWGITMSNAYEITSLAPNQSINGYLYFIIGQYYNPNQLICSITVNNPIFSINLNTK